MNLFLLLFERDPKRSYVAFHDDLTSHPKISTWFHYLTGAYILGTDLAEGELAELVQGLFVKHSLPLFMLVVAVDLDHFAGFLPKRAWDWLHRNATDIKLGRIRSLYGSLGSELEVLEQLSKTSRNPTDIIERSWEILKENVVKTARALGFRPKPSAESELKQALFHLTTRVLNSQRVMIAVYQLAIDRKKADVKAEDAERFAVHCISIIAQLRLELDKNARQPEDS